MTKIPSERKDTGHPDSHENSLILVPRKKPNADAQEETEECGGDKEILAFHLFSRGLKSIGKHDVPAGIHAPANGMKIRRRSSVKRWGRL